MKLRAEMKDGCVHANGYCVDEDAVELRQAEMLVHDAAAAHALMMAMDEIGGYTTKFIQLRADTIMREWGFDTGEDA
jgi:hypothetical protein